MKNHSKDASNNLIKLKDIKNNDDISQLQTHLKQIKEELTKTNKQIKLFEKQKKANSEWKNFGFLNGKSITELKKEEDFLKNEIIQTTKKIKKRSKTLLALELTLLPVLFLLIIFSGLGSQLYDSVNDSTGSFQSKYFVENLRGDSLVTWKSWRLVEPTMNVNLIVPNNIPEEKANIVIEAISSMEAIEIDDSLVKNGPAGSTSLYYLGWKGALNDVNNKKINTEYVLPLDFNIMNSSRGEGDIIVTLSNLKDTDGFTGYTKSIIDGNEILKSFITIYDTANLSNEQLATIARHEFGHALGLGHSTAPEDLMAPTIDMTYPFISECNVAAMIDLYNGNEGSKTICEK